MKKILSLLIAMTLFASAFATVAFAGSVNADNKLTLSMSEPVEKEGFTNDAIDSFIEENEFDIDEFVVYQIDFTVGNLPKLTKSSSNYSGEGLTNIAVGLMIDTTATYEEDFAVFPKGTTVTPDGNKYAMAFYGNADMTKLVKAAGVSAGGSVVAGTVYLLVKPDYYYNVYLAPQAGGNMATFSGGSSSSGTGVYDILANWIDVDDADYDIGEPGSSTTQYTIAFQDWNGTPLGSDTYDEGATVTAPADPTREGYTFTGWSPAFSATAAADVTYTATYTQDNYTIKFVDEDGTTDVIAPVTNAHYGDAITAPASNPTKPGKTFAGWSPAVPATVTGSQTFTATYTQDNYTITFYDEDGETVIGTPVTNAHYGDAISAPTAPAKAGKTFTGWSPAVPATVTGTASFTATYGDASYTVAFKTYDGASDIQSASYKYGDAVAVPGKDIVPARAGYVFAGWAEKENGALSDRVTPATTATADATYYAVYVAIPAQTSATNVGVAALRGTELTKLDDSAAGTADADYYGGKVEFNPNTEFFGYRVLLKGHVIGSEEIVEKECDPIVFGTEGDVELSAGSTASFTVLVKTKARVITDIIIKAFEK